MGEEADPSTIGRAGVTLRPPMVVLRSIGGGIDMVGDDVFDFEDFLGAGILIQLLIVLCLYVDTSN